MTSTCPHCRASAEAGSAGPLTGRCPACGGSFAPGLASEDPGLLFDDGSSACPLRFGSYRVLGVIGQGGMGVVYHALHDETGEEVAVKTVRVRKRGMLQRIRREVQALARIKHPGLVRIIETGQSDGQPWYAMELVKGQSLHDRLRLTSPGKSDAPGTHTPEASSGWDTRADFILAIDPDEDSPAPVGMAEGATSEVGGSVAEPPPSLDSFDVIARSITTAEVFNNQAETPTALIANRGEAGVGIDPGPKTEWETIPEGETREFLILMVRLCETLAYLHGEGVVHRDVKPQNIIIRPDGTPVLLDFGLVSFFGADGRECLEVGVSIEGTPEYMSPEQIRGGCVDARADLYSVGCILYQGLTGQVPFLGSTPHGTLRAHLKNRPTPPVEHNSRIPSTLNALILNLLAKQSVRRIGYARDIVATLDRLGCAGAGWETCHPPRDYLYRPEFVGRSSVVTKVERHVRRSLTHPGRCIFLRGPSGVGKTRLIVELARQFERGGLAVVTGECLPIGGGGGEDDRLDARATPLHPFRSFLQMVVDCCLERGPDEAARLLGPSGRLLAECEPALASLAGLTDEPDPVLDGEESPHSRLIDALGEALAEYGRTSPVVVFLDDLEWADPMTLHFLALFHVGAWDGPNVAIVASYRTEEEAEALRGYRPVFQDATFIDLGPLGEESLGEVVLGMLGSHEVDLRFVSHLAGKSAGNPFFVAEYLRSAVAEGMLGRDAAGCWRMRTNGDRLDPESLDGSIPLPASLRDLVIRRLEGLTPAANRLVEVAAVFGREVEGDCLEVAGRLGESESMAAVATLVVSHVLEETRDGRFRFVHDSIREIAYERIDPHRRRELHRFAALAIEDRHVGRGDRTRHSGALAHHWSQSIDDQSADPEVVERAIHYLESASRLATHSGLTAEAVDYGRAAARLLDLPLPDGRDRAAIEEALRIELDQLQQILGGRRPVDLIELAASTNTHADRLIAVLLAIQPQAFLGNQFGLFALMASKNLATTLRSGLGPLAPTVLAMFAIVARIKLDDAWLASEFAEAAVELDRRQGGSQAAAVRFLKSWFVDHWLIPIQDAWLVANSGASIGMASREVIYGCYSHGAAITLQAAAGEPLARVVADAEARLAMVGRRVPIARFHCVLERQFALALMSRTRSPTSLSDDTYDESRDLVVVGPVADPVQTAHYHVARLKLETYLGRPREALLAADEALTVDWPIAGQTAQADLVFFRALALLAVAHAEVEPSRSGRLAEVRDLLARLHRWRGDSETTFAPKAFLVEAELARFDGCPDTVRELHDQAIWAADAAGFLHLSALARDLAARHLARIGLDAGPMLQAAIDGYRAWGASLLADRLDDSGLTGQGHCPGSNSPSGSVPANSEPPTTLMSPDA